MAKVVPALAGIQPVLAFLGEPFMALLLATIAAMYLLGTRHGYSNAQLEKIMTKSLEPTGMILLVTACGGVLRYMLQNSGLGDVIGNAVANASLPLVLVAFIVAALVRISVGSSTVAMTMAAGIISAMPGISELSPLYLACVTAASQAAPPSALTSTTPASGWSRVLWAWMKRPPSRPGPSWKRWSAVWASWWHWSSPSLPDRPSGACTPG